MPLATAATASAACRPAFSGSTKPSASSANKARACGSRDCISSGRAALSAPRRSCRHRRCDTAVRASVHVGDPEWFANQALAAGVILGGFVATGGLDELKRGGERDFREEPGEPCSMCEGTGRTECMCTRWSSDGEGCSSCGYTGVSICPACRGGGRAVRVTLEIPVEKDEVSAGSRGSDRSNIELHTLPNYSAAIAMPSSSTSSDEVERRSLARMLDETTRGADSFYVVAEPRSEPGGPGGEGGGDPSSSKDDDFYAQSGEAIRTLRDDYPDLLNKPMQWGIYREDVGLVDETESFGHMRGHVVASGIREYKRCHKWLRTAAAILFSKAEVNVSRIWSPLGTNGVRSIKVRWAIKAKLRIVGGITEEAHFDGISEYKLDNRGFIYQHTITDLDWDVAQMRDRVAALSNILAQQSREPQLGSGQWFENLVPEGWFRK